MAFDDDTGGEDEDFLSHMQEMKSRRKCSPKEANDRSREKKQREDCEIRKVSVKKCQAL